MYVPPAFRADNIENIRATISSARLANLITATAEGPLATPLPLFLDPTEGERGVLYGHLAKANPQWRAAPIGEALAVFLGPEAYVTPSWCATKQETEKVVPTWNYIAVHAYGPVEFFEDNERLLDVVTRLTNIHEGSRVTPWSVSDAPADFHRRPVAWDCRNPHSRHQVRGQAQDEPEPSSCRPYRCRHRPCREPRTARSGSQHHGPNAGLSHDASDRKARPSCVRVPVLHFPGSGDARGRHAGTWHPLYRRAKRLLAAWVKIWCRASV